MRELEYTTETVVTLDNDGDKHKSDVTFAVVTDDTKGQEVVLRNGNAHELRTGDVVVKDGNAYDVFTAKEWTATWEDSERVVDSGNILNAPADTSTESDPEANGDAPSGTDPATKAAPSGKRG